MKINLDKNSRKFITIDVEQAGKTHTLKYFEKNTKQIDSIKKAYKAQDENLDEFALSQFKENLVGDEDVKNELFAYYEENGNIYEFAQECTEALGKLKKKA